MALNSRCVPVAGVGISNALTALAGVGESPLGSLLI